jgi:hypothetical protein
MTQIEAIKRLRFTLSKGNKPNQTDIEALNSILLFFDSTQKKQVEDNRIFAKLLAIDLKYRYERCNDDINSALKNLSQDLKQKLEFHIGLLSAKMTTSQITNYIKGLTIEVPESEFNDPIALANRENDFWDMHQRSIIDEILFSNSEEQLKNEFYTTANEILNNDNYRQ